MKLKYKYTIFIAVLHIILVIGLYYLLIDKKWLFIGSEVLVLVSLFLSYNLYKQLIKPIDLMQTGISALEDNDFNIKFVNTGSKEMDKLISVYNTMLDKLRLERTSMEEQSYFLQKLFEVSPFGMLILDFDNNIEEINPRLKSYLDPSKNYIGHPIQYYPHPLLKQIENINPGTKKLVTINSVKKYNILVNQVIHKGFPKKFIIVEELTHEIIETEKKAYGKVIRMMAHEVNNSMGAVNSILDTIHEYAFENGKNEDLKSALEVAMDRNKSLGIFIDNFADVIRLPLPHLEKTSINHLLQKVGQLYNQRALAKSIKIDYKLLPVDDIECDAIQMEQVITNIIKNAIESIENDGTIILGSTQSPPGFYIQDNGVGILPDNVQYLFTPFFSTKQKGQGIGLILCRDILQNHGAQFNLTTDKKTGWTTFEVIF